MFIATTMMRTIEPAPVRCEKLLDVCGPAEGKIEILPDDCEARIWWSAYSDSVQGGFVLPIEISRRIVALGVDVYATVYLSGEDGGEER